MGKSKIVKYLIQGKRNGKFELIATSDKKPTQTAEWHRQMFNNSLKKGGCNEHLGIKYNVSNTRIVNQYTGKIISEFKAPLFEMI